MLGCVDDLCVNLLDFHELFNNVRPQHAQILIQQRLEDLFLKLLVDSEPLLVVFNEIAILGYRRVEYFKVGLRKLLYVVLLDVKVEHLGDAERVPDKRSPSQFVVEGV